MESGNEPSNGCELECQEQVWKHSVTDKRDLLDMMFTIRKCLGTNEIVFRIIVKSMKNKLFNIRSFKKIVDKSRLLICNT